MRKFEWAVVGSGIAGIVAAEILTRQGHSVVLIEKNEKIASETTRDFHEWVHTGSLYTLIPDKLLTLKFMLGAIDDLFEFYNTFENMNLITTEKGLNIRPNEHGWFEENNIHFKYRLKHRKWTFPWIFGIARSIFLIERIKGHDWLRRRGGVTEEYKLKYKEIFNIVKELYKCRDKFFDYKTSDFTTHSRHLITDLIKISVKNGMQISLSNEFKNFEKKDSNLIVNCVKESFEVNKIVLCIGEKISKFTDAKVKFSYAPIAVVKNLNSNVNSFVELDYYPENCINLITKTNGIGLIGGISFSDKNKCEPYMNEVIKKHKEYNPALDVLHTYNGVKSEIVFKDQPRNYLYHILQMQENIWEIIPGKFTLGFSIAPEFYRRVYGRNPKKTVSTNGTNDFDTNLISNTVWYDVFNNNKNKDN